MGCFSSFLMRRMDLLRQMAFRRGWPFRRPVDPRARKQYKMPHATAASRAEFAAFPRMIPENDRHPNP